MLRPTYAKAWIGRQQKILQRGEHSGKAASDAPETRSVEIWVGVT